MIYTTKERNNAITAIANGNADISKTALYERLESFRWINIKRSNGIINAVELSYWGKNLYTRLLNS